MNSEKNISPGLASGFKDYLPKDMIPRQKMFDAIRSVFERFGFVPLDTPGIEREDVLTGGDPNFRMQIFRTSLREGDEGLALRFDLTVPLARVVSLYGDQLERPFKRYHTGKVWRGEKPQAGRFREFIQFDADIVGAARMSADAEIISLMYETMVALGIDRFKIRVNNRKILNGLARFAGFDASKSVEVLRTIDKLDKIGWEGVAKELSEKELGLAQVESLRTFLDLNTDSVPESLDRLSSLMSNSPEAMQGISELGEMAKNIEALGVPQGSWGIDLSVARGLGYYTGPVFETMLLDLPSIGSVFSGGRYDDLVSRFGGQNLPATGASVGVDRLFAAMEELRLVSHSDSTAQAIVLNFDPATEIYCQRIAGLLRREGIRTELYLGKEENLKAQLAYALRRSPKAIVIAGGSEASKLTAQVKDVANRKQTETGINEIAGRVKEILTQPSA